jgi:hypothetical protein
MEGKFHSPESWARRVLPCPLLGYASLDPEPKFLTQGAATTDREPT